jgi:hypothetical protein
VSQHINRQNNFWGYLQKSIITINENPEEKIAKTYPKIRKWLLLTKKLQKI